MKEKILSILFAILAWSAGAQRRMDFKIIAGDKGLSENVVNSIVQDKDGFIWFATNDGLNRYDGYSITQYRYDLSEENTLSSNVITALSVDSEGLIWIGTSDGGLNCYNPRNNRFINYSHVPSDISSLSAGMIDEIVEDQAGNIWINIRNKGIDVLIRDGAEAKFLHYSSNNMGNNSIAILKSNNIFKIIPASQGGVWVASPKGLQRIVAGREICEDLTFLGSIATSATVAVHESPEGGLAVIQQDGTIFKGSLEDSDFSIRETLHTSAFEGKVSIDADLHGSLWIADANGLQKVNGSNIYHYRKGGIPLNNLPSNRILSVFIDKSNVLWAGTYNYGVLNYDLDSELYYNFDDLMLTEQEKRAPFFDYAVHAICEDRYGAIWVGSEGGGLLRIREGLAAFTEGHRSVGCDFINASDAHSWLIDNNIYSMLNDSKGRLWIGCSTGLLRLTFKSTTNPAHISPSDIEIEKYFFNDVNIFGEGAVFVIKEDNRGNIWISCWNNGLYRYDETRNKFTGYCYNPAIDGSLPYNTIRDIFFESNDEAWLATAGGGLVRMFYHDDRKESPYFVTFADKAITHHTLSNNYILNLAKDEQGNLWMGTFGGGINKMSEEDGKYRFTHYLTHNSNIPSNTIKGLILSDSNKLWVTTNRELFRISALNNRIDGVIKSQEFNIEEFKDNAIYRFESGYIMFGGTNGIALVADNLHYNPSITLRPALTNLYVNNQPVDQIVQSGGKLELPKDENTIELMFSAMYYKGGSDIIYSACLDGYDKEPIVTTNNSVRYTQLPHGRYEFTLKASTDGVNWSSDALRFSIVILPPFWLSGYAYIIYFVLLALTVSGVYKIVSFRITTRNKINIERIKRQEMEKSHLLKMQFFTNISHELRTPIGLIINPLNSIIADKSIEEKHGPMLKLIQRNSLRLNKLVNQLLDIRRMESGMLPVEIVEEDIIPFIYQIFKLFEDMAIRKESHFRFSCELPTLVIPFDPDKIEKILYNLLSNAFKFTDPGGTILLALKEGSAYLSVEVIDTGIGIKEEEKSGIFQYFHQGSHSQQYVGSGIGLAYAYNLARSFNGVLDFSSEYGKGSRFTLKLPLNRDNYKDFPRIDNYVRKESEFLKQEMAQLGSAIDGTAQKETASTHDRTILIVDDNKDLLYYLSMELRSNYNIITAANGIEGVSKAKEYLPDLIISDVMMPQMDGLEMCRILKTDISTCHIPIIILTAKADEGSELNGLEIGADQYILKPIKMDILRLKIKNILVTKEQLRKQISETLNSSEFKENCTKNEQMFLDRMEQIVKQNINDPYLNIDKLSEELGMSRSALYKRIKQITDMSTTEYVRYIKLKEAVSLFNEDKYTIEQVTYQVGFSDPKYFRKCFKNVFGKSPSEYIKSLKKSR